MSALLSPDLLAMRLRELRVVPVIVMEDARQAIPLANALADAGLACAEITLRTPAAVEALTRIVRTRPDFVVGAGTVLTVEQADEAKRAGAHFAVAPGFNSRVVQHCQAIGLPMYPGVSTPSEIEAAMAIGVRIVKLFPAEQLGGVSYLEAIAAPYGEIEFMPTGGIGRESLAAYLKLPSVIACGGSWMAPRAWIAAAAFDRIRDETRAVIQLLAQLRTRTASA